MDKIIPPEILARRKKKTFVIVIFTIVVICTAVLLLRTSLKSSVPRTEITTAVVELGSIENTLNASGEVLPEFEEVITSPISASIKSAVIDAGSRVSKGQSVLSLDKETAETEYRKLNFQLEQKKTGIQKLRLELNKSFFDIQSNNDIKQLRISSLEASVDDAKRLYKAGGGTRESIEQAELALKVAQLEKKQLENEIKSKQQTMRADIKESELGAAIQQSDLNEYARKLHQANIIARRSGVVTWVNKNIGSTVQAGEILARIADLGSFKITGSISDAYADQLRTGMPAIIRIGDSTLRGTVTGIHPAVQNSIVYFDVSLNEKNNKLFRPNMKVEIFIVTASRNNIMRVANGAAFKGSTTQDIFVVKNDKAERRSVNIGFTNFDYVEIGNNVKPGDVIITSDMSEYKNAKELTIKN